jgi:hypothetical protein
MNGSSHFIEQDG